KVVANDQQGKLAEERIVRTAGKAHHIVLETQHKIIAADGKSVAYVRVKVLEKEGNICTKEGALVHFSVTGAGQYRAAANGDPTCLDMFHEPKMHLFNGQLTAIVQAGEQSGDIQLEAKSKGLKSGKIRVKVE